MKIYFVIVVTLTILVQFGNSELINSLPGLSGALNFKQYSGYLNGSETHKLHYWFTESQNDPAFDPFLVWLNGGPGCSSLGGLLTELGPLRVADDGFTLKRNPYSWNQKANILFLEAPAGVGFSYSTDGNVTTDDDQTSEESYNALREFFTNVMPQYRKHDLYITGESYGGVYVPTLTSRILNGLPNFPLNIKGMAIGNGLLSEELNTNSLVKFAYAHGLVDEKLWSTLETACCNGCADTCNFNELSKVSCQRMIQDLTEMTWNQGLNVYDLYRDCYGSQEAMVSRYRVERMHLAPKPLRNNLNFKKTSLLNHFYAKPHLRAASSSSDTQENGAPPCLNETAATNYLNRGDVKRAIGIPEGLPPWAMCSDSVGAVYKKVHMTVRPEVLQALSAKLRVLIYNGDTDMACNFLGGQEFCHSLGIPLIHQKKQWRLNGQVVGFATKYKNLDFVTVKGAGHMVPEWRAAPAFDMITRFLEDTPF